MVVEEQAARRGFGDAYADGHLFENLCEAVAFGFDLFEQALAISLGLLTPADVVDHELNVWLPFIVEADTANLCGEVPSVLTSKLDLDLLSQPIAGYRVIHTLAAGVQMLGGKEIGDLQADHMVRGASEHPHH